MASAALGLAQQLGIPASRGAASYIKQYLDRFSELREYMEDTKAFARGRPGMW